MIMVLRVTKIFLSITFTGCLLFHCVCAPVFHGCSVRLNRLSQAWCLSLHWRHVCRPRRFPRRDSRLPDRFLCRWRAAGPWCRQFQEHGKSDLQDLNSRVEMKCTYSSEWLSSAFIADLILQSMIYWWKYIFPYVPMECHYNSRMIVRQLHPSFSKLEKVCISVNRADRRSFQSLFHQVLCSLVWTLVCTTSTNSGQELEMLLFMLPDDEASCLDSRLALEIRPIAA